MVHTDRSESGGSPLISYSNSSKNASPATEERFCYVVFVALFCSVVFVALFCYVVFVALFCFVVSFRCLFSGMPCRFFFIFPFSRIFARASFLPSLRLSPFLPLSLIFPFSRIFARARRLLPPRPFRLSFLLPPFSLLPCC